MRASLLGQWRALLLGCTRRTAFYQREKLCFVRSDSCPGMQNKTAVCCCHGTAVRCPAYPSQEENSGLNLTAPLSIDYDDGIIVLQLLGVVGGTPFDRLLWWHNCTTRYKVQQLLGSVGKYHFDPYHHWRCLFCYITRSRLRWYMYSAVVQTKAVGIPLRQEIVIGLRGLDALGAPAWWWWINKRSDIIVLLYSFE